MTSEPFPRSLTSGTWELVSPVQPAAVVEEQKSILAKPTLVPAVLLVPIVAVVDPSAGFEQPSFWGRPPPCSCPNVGVVHPLNAGTSGTLIGVPPVRPCGGV
jgi:hypothetical protein